MLNNFFCLMVYLTENAATNVTVATTRCNSDAVGVIFHHINENIHRQDTVTETTAALTSVLFSTY
jgi:hypothetical protein